MDWKEFFRPTIGKLILFLIILVIFVPFIRYDNGIRCFIFPCPADTTGSAAMWMMSRIYAGHIYEINYSSLTLGLIISYFASCLIISIFKKTQKKNT